MKPAAYTCPNCGRTVPDWYKSHVCIPRKKDLDRAAKIDPGVALAKRLAATQCDGEDCGDPVYADDGTHSPLCSIRLVAAKC